MCSKCAFLTLLCAFSVGLSAAADEADSVKELGKEMERPALYRSSRDFRDLAQKPLFTDKLTYGIQVSVLTEIEDDDEKTAFDGMELALEALPVEGIEGTLILSYEDIENEGESIMVDEAFIRFGATEDFPFYFEGGKFELPFGEFNSSFIEDPSVVFIGEILDQAITVGYEGNVLELAVSSFSGASSDGGGFDEWVVTLIADVMDGLEVGAFWTADVGEADELSMLIEESLPEAPEADEDESDGEGDLS